VIRFCCEHCGYKIGVQETHVGKRGKCPTCGAVITVPAESTLIEFDCADCGGRLAVPRTHAGRKVICPNCQNVIFVPVEGKTPAVSAGVVSFACSTCNQQIEEPESSRGKLIQCPHCRSYVAVPSPQRPADKIEALIRPDEKNDTSEEHFEQLQIGSLKEFKREPDLVTERKLPWIFDIFLYPMSTSGMTVLAMVVVVRFLCRVVVMYLAEASRAFLPCLAFFGLTWAVAMVVRIVLYMYLCWYLCECVRGSAAGGVRAVETKGYTPGLGETLGQTIKAAGCLLLYLGPPVFYFMETKEANWIFWCLTVYGMFFFPMSFLAVVMFESWQGLNPILLISSVFTTFLPYFAMILTFIAASVAIMDKAPNPLKSPLTFFITWLVGVYLAMIVAHVLGSFYHRYKEKLNWDV
jgi:DNA-directed RNA polymerase subunit RPC12/RpoP